MNIIFLGPISCGKGTQSNFVAEEYNLVHISIGELLRERRNIEDEVGLKIAHLQKEGKLVDDDITLQVLEEKIKECDRNQGILFDANILHFPIIRAERGKRKAEQCAYICIERVVLISVTNSYGFGH